MTVAIFLLSLIPPFLYGISNYIDKILLEKYFKDGGTPTLIMFSALLSFLALPVIFLLEPAVFGVSIGNIALLSLVAALNLGVLWFYLLALEQEDASNVILFYQLVPVFTLILSYFVWSELPTAAQLWGMGIIMFGTFLVSFVLDENNQLHFRKKTIFYMTIACLFWSTETVIFKDVALEENVLISLFWEHVVLVLIGIGLFTFIPKYRRNFIDVFKTNSTKVIGANFINESLFIVANSIAALAVFSGTTALVMLNVPIQSIFVFIFGLLLTTFVPHIIKEDINKRHLIQKIAAIILTTIGVYVLLSA